MSKGKDDPTGDYFVSVVQTRVLIRCLQTVKERSRGRHPEGAVDTQIVLYAASMDYDHNHYLCEVLYHAAEPFGDYLTGLQVRAFGHRHDLWAADFNIKLIPGWERTCPEWVVAEPVVAVRRRKGGVETIPPTSLSLMMHFARLQQRLAYEIRCKASDSQALCNAYYRLSSFIEQRENDWRRVIAV